MCCVKRTTVKIKSTINFACSHITKQWPTGIPSLVHMGNRGVGVACGRGCGTNTLQLVFLLRVQHGVCVIQAHAFARRVFLWPLLTYATHKMP